jgi:hypothetical protein
VAQFQTAAALVGRSPFALSYLAASLADAGRAGEARAIYQELLDNRTRMYVDSGSLAITSYAAGDVEASVEHTHEACDRREATVLITWRVRPGAQRLRSDPRFADIARRLRVPGTAP